MLASYKGKPNIFLIFSENTNYYASIMAAWAAIA